MTSDIVKMARVCVAKTYDLLLVHEESLDWCVKLVATVKESEFEDEKVSEELASELLDEGTGCCGRSTCFLSVVVLIGLWS